jgi:hypothetical protein
MSVSCIVRHSCPEPFTQDTLHASFEDAEAGDGMVLPEPLCHLEDLSSFHPAHHPKAIKRVKADSPAVEQTLYAPVYVQSRL